MTDYAKSKIMLWLAILAMLCLAFAAGEQIGERISARKWKDFVGRTLLADDVMRTSTTHYQAGDCFKLDEQLIAQPIECPQ